MAGKLGEILLEENLITPDQLKQALEHQKANGGRLGNSLVRLGFLSDDGGHGRPFPPIRCPVH